MIGSDGEATPRETRSDDDEDDDKRDENAMPVATMLRIDVEGKPLTYTVNQTPSHTKEQPLPGPPNPQILPQFPSPTCTVDQTPSH